MYHPHPSAVLESLIALLVFDLLPKFDPNFAVIAIHLLQCFDM